jgi:hypothetical protein
MATPFNISSFRGALQGGGARPNLFRVLIPDPFMGAAFSYMCKGGSLPGSDIGTVEVPYFGRNVKLPGNRTFPEWTATVINDENFTVHQRFIDWMADIDSHEPNLQTGTQAPGGGLVTDITIDQMAKEGGTPLKSIQLVNAWPSSLAAIDLAWDSNDAIEEFTVTFQYDLWEVR